MTKRGIQIGGAGPLPVRRTAQGEAGARNTCRTTASTGTDPVPAVVAAHAEPRSTRCPASSGYWNFNKVSDDTYFSDLSDRVGLTSQTTLPREGGFTYTNGPWTVLARAQAFQTLQDPTAAAADPLQPRAAGCS